MTTIYIVYGSTGEYSDRSEWPVAAYMDETLARTHRESRHMVRLGRRRADLRQVRLQAQEPIRSAHERQLHRHGLVRRPSRVANRTTESGDANNMTARETLAPSMGRP